MASWTIGIDPSAAHDPSGDAQIGWCLFMDDRLINYGELMPDPDTGFTRVRNWLRGKFKGVYVNDPSPIITVAVETAFAGPNIAIYGGLIRVKAHLESVTLDACHKYAEVSPMQSFQASTGLTQYPLNDKGKRSGTRKNAIQSAVKERYDLPEDVSSHVCDAIAIAESIIQRHEKSAG